MPVDPLQRLIEKIQSLEDRIKSIETAPSQQNMTVDKGATRILSDEGLQIGAPGSANGSAIVYGRLVVFGKIDGDGVFEWSGSWKFDSGDGEIAGDVKLTGDFDLLGALRAGDVRIEDGKIHIGTMVLDPTDHDGMITMPNDGQILAEGDNIEIYGPNGTGGRNGIIIKPDHIMVAKLPVATSTAGLRWVAADIIGNLWAVPPNIGGPAGGPLRWPFPPSTVTSEYGPRESPGPGGSTFHEGIDFAPGEGTPIPAAAAGTVELAGVNGGFGNCVIINHGDGLKTLYGHMQSTPSVTVGQQVSAGQTIGAVGNTGVSFGAHLHFEVHVDGMPVNPRTKLPQN